MNDLEHQWGKTLVASSDPVDILQDALKKIALQVKTALKDVQVPGTKVEVKLGQYGFFVSCVVFTPGVDKIPMPGSGFPDERRDDGWAEAVGVFVKRWRAQHIPKHTDALKVLGKDNQYKIVLGWHWDEFFPLDV